MSNEITLIESNGIIPADRADDARRLLQSLNWECTGDAGEILATAGYGIVEMPDGSLVIDGCSDAEPDADTLLVALAPVLASTDGQPVRFRWVDEDYTSWLQILCDGVLITYIGHTVFDQ